MLSKERIYLPYLHDADILTCVFTDVPTIDLDEAGFLQFTNERATPELLYQHVHDQAPLLADFAAEQNISFLDLTPAFQREAGAGADTILLTPIGTSLVTTWLLKRSTSTLRKCFRLLRVKRQGIRDEDFMLT